MTIFAGDVLSQDITPPDVPELQYVTVDPFTNNITIGWTLCDSADTKGYIIFRKIENYEIIDSVKSPFINTYVDITASGGLHSELYRIAAYDSSGNQSPLTPINEYHNTIYIFPYQVKQDCINKIKITFNQYQYWPEGLAGYRIYRDIDYSGNFAVIDTAPANATVYYDTDIENGVSYCYYIEAVSNSGKTSTSNKTCKSPVLPDTVKYINADYATVADYNLVEIAFTTDTAAENVSYYKLLSTSDTTSSFASIAKFDFTLNPKIYYSEYVDIGKEIKYYKLAAFNECNQIVCESNIAQNILLNVSHGEDLIHKLNWNAYDTWLGGIDNIEVYKIDVDKTTELIATIYSDVSFSNDISNFLGQKVSGDFCYYVVAKEGGANPYGIKGESRSNIACIEEEPIVWVPNIFTPDNNGINDIFLPSVSFASLSDYSFQIYDRWGNIIFETNDPTAGWDGKIQGNNAKEGTYVYLIKFTTALNKIFEQSGMITLMIR